MCTLLKRQLKKEPSLLLYSHALVALERKMNVVRHSRHSFGSWSTFLLVGHRALVKSFTRWKNNMNQLFLVKRNWKRTIQNEQTAAQVCWIQEMKTRRQRRPRVFRQWKWETGLHTLFNTEVKFIVQESFFVSFLYPFTLAQYNLCPWPSGVHFLLLLT